MKILFLVTNDWYFWSHRLALARAARDAGAEVLVMTGLNAHRAALELERFRVIPWRSVSARGMNPFREALAVWEVIVAYRRFRPDLVHHIALKPALYGGLAALLCGRIPSIQTIAGLGYLFTDPPRKILWLRWLLLVGLSVIQRAGKLKTIFQNPDDRDFFTAPRILRAKDSVLIRGSGVNLSVFLPLPEPSGVPVVTLAARMLWDKGIAEFVEAAGLLRGKGVKARFVLAGRVDPTSPGSVTEEQLQTWDHNGDVEWWGYSEDIRAVLSGANLVCLPSYREGLPKILLEAGACGRAVVTTDAPGCREVVRDGENGLLVPPKNASALGNAILRLLEDARLRASMGKGGRVIVEEEFSERMVTQRTLGLYREVLNGRWPTEKEAPLKSGTLLRALEQN